MRNEPHLPHSSATSFGARIFAFAITVSIVQYAGYQALPEVFGPPHLETSKLSRISPPTVLENQVLFLGDSSIRDTLGDGPTIPQLVEEQLNNVRAIAVDQPGYHLGVFAEYVRLITSLSVRPRAIIIPINLCFLDPKIQPPGFEMNTLQWRIRLWRHPVTRASIRPLIVLKAFSDDLQSRREWLDQRIWSAGRPRGCVQDFVGEQFKIVTPENMKKKLEFSYLMDFDPNSSRLSALEELQADAQSLSIPVLAYVVPIDIETGERHHGLRFRELVKMKIKRLRQICSRPGTSFLDLSDQLPALRFTWRKEESYPYPNSHFDQQGMEQIAASLAQELRRVAQPSRSREKGVALDRAPSEKAARGALGQSSF